MNCSDTLPVSNRRTGSVTEVNKEGLLRFENRIAVYYYREDICRAPASLLLTGYVNNDKAMMRNSIKTGAAIGLNLFLTSGLKYVVNRPRPFIQYPNDIVKRTEGGIYSFPSGHTSTAFATATALSLSTKKWYVAVPSYAYACAVGYSRMRLGVHFPSDVLGGMILGIGSSLLVFQIDKWLQQN